MNSFQSTLIVHYQVTHKDVNPPLVRYRCDHKSGFAMTKEMMLERIKISPLTIKYFNQIELIEVDDLDLVLHGSATNPYAIKSLFETHRQLGIPIRYSVLLVFKWLQLDMGSFCAEAGFHRNYLNVVLSGKRQPSDLIRAKLIEKIGLDPWQYAEWLKPTVISQETIQLAKPFIQNAKA